MATKKLKQPALDGMEDPVDEELSLQAITYVDKRDARMALTKEEVSEREKLAEMMRDRKLKKYSDRSRDLLVEIEAGPQKIKVRHLAAEVKVEPHDELKPIGDDVMTPKKGGKKPVAPPDRVLP